MKKTNCKDKKLLSKFKTAEKLVKKIKFDFDKLPKHGYIRVKNQSVFINKKKNLVIKNCSIRVPEVPPKAVPTLFIKSFNGVDKIVVQPLVNVTKSAQEKAYSYFRSLKSEDQPNDLHHGNVGYYKGKPTVIDW
jgi:hypothetical protein